MVAAVMPATRVVAVVAALARRAFRSSAATRTARDRVVEDLRVLEDLARLAAGDSAEIMMVRELPPRAFLGSLVSTESRYGTRTPGLPCDFSASAEMKKITAMGSMTMNIGQPSSISARPARKFQFQNPP